MPTLLPPPDRGSFSVAWREVTAIATTLTDLSFRQFVTPRIVRTLYLMSLIGAGLASVAWMFHGFKEGFLYGLFTLVTGPVAFFVYILSARVALEFMLAVFRIAENTEKLREKSDRREP
ncbi:MAG: hypothetical protein JWO94_1677 [Verrucomicrobiaceae bacterium]|nr:hypothetical protein [Verrucomicrobiaceae bacterium]